MEKRASGDTIASDYLEDISDTQYFALIAAQGEIPMDGSGWMPSGDWLGKRGRGKG
jgi:hypothetical protein